VVKHNAAALFREFLAKKSWQPEPIMLSGVTDCYQPAEREFRLTRQCLEVAWECRQPVCIITKNALITRDRDLLKQLAAARLVNVFLSIPTLQPELARDMEPRTSIPQSRLRAITMLAEVGVPVGVMVAPVIPGLTDSEIPAILAAAEDAGAITASSTLLRLPLTVEPVFREWLERTQPLKAERILGLIRHTRGGELSSSNWGERMTGQGEIAGQIAKLFHLFREKHNLQQPMPARDCDMFRPPRNGPKQLELFLKTTTGPRLSEITYH
jgi:DNA repair photolyase